jgi:hypothetical protein
MKRENRRIAAMSWGACDDDGPPKPPKPMTDSTSKLFQLSQVDDRPENGTGSQMTYIIAKNPAVLAQLMKENERRLVNPSSYTTPASVFNVVAVEIDEATENKPVEDVSMKTVQIPAMEMIPLQQDKIDIIDISLTSQATPPQPSPPSLPNPENLGMSNEAAVVYPTVEHQQFVAVSPSGLPPSGLEKTRSLERNANAAPSVFARISSLERRQQDLKNNQRSQSLIRQYSGGVQQAEAQAIRSASLERNQQMPYNFKATYSNSLEKFQNATPPPPPYIKSMNPTPQKGGSLERSQAIMMNDLMRKYYDQRAMAEAQKPRSGGSLERNSQYQQFLLLQKQQLQQQLQAQQAQVQAQKQQQMQLQQQQQQEELIEENIYDFGGVHVKSCASIALKKSIERGMIPPTAFRTFDPYDPIPSPTSGPSSLEMNRPITPQQQQVAQQQAFRQPSPNIASRMMIFQQGTSQPVRQPLVQYQNPMLQKPFPPNQNFYIPPSGQPEPMPMQVRDEKISVEFCFVC